MTDTPNGPPRGTDGPGQEPTPEEIGDELFHRLDTLDDRLQRSQEKMIALLDRKLNGSEPAGASPRNGASADRGSRPAEEARWAPSPAGSDLDGRTSRGAEPVATPGSMDAWFADGHASASTVTEPPPGDPGVTARSVAADEPVDAASARDRRPEQLPVLAQPGVLAPYDHGSDEPAPSGAATSAQGAEPLPEVVPAGGRPAWQSNLITVVAVVVVVIVGLFLVGLF